MGGANMILSDGDVLEGSFTNVTRFEVPYGATVTVTRGIPFELAADNVWIYGTLDATGAGLAGGAGGPLGSAVEGDPGMGPGAGNPGKQGPCVHGGGGGGAGYGADGGDGGYAFTDGSSHYPNLGVSYGALDVPTLELGSGGGGGGSGCNDAGGRGGAGGGVVFIEAAAVVHVDGAILASGEPGRLGDQYGGHGGGGSGGTLVLMAPIVSGVGSLVARGGVGGGPEVDASFESDGGGGGGGRVKIGQCGAAVMTTDVLGGAVGGTCIGGSAYCPSAGADGTVDLGLGDSDLDGVNDACDQCEGSDDSLDADGDGTPDGCDLCAGGDDSFDTDGDGTPDDCDACPLPGDEVTDTDGDGVADGCDNCPLVVNASQDDSDGDFFGDACDLCPGWDDRLDSDADGTPDDCDLCPFGDDVTDSDGDGVPDACDVCAYGPDDIDMDGDGVPDACDLCAGADDHLDADYDGVPDACDVCPGYNDSIDSDGDGVADGCDDCPVDPLDDSDGDGICDSDDRCPGGDDRLDTDGDMRPDFCDNCPYEPNPQQGDQDMDGHGVACDCDDNNDAVHPEADEYCNGNDDDCDGAIDEDGVDGWVYYADNDGDAQGDPDTSVTACNPVDGYVINNEDCDDTDPTVHSEAVEACDGVDNDCDGSVDEDAGCADSVVDEGASGCGCSNTGAGPTGGLLWLGLLALLARRRAA